MLIDRVPQFPSYTLLSGLLALLAAPTFAHAQAAFDPPPFPTDSAAPTPTVRGLYDPTQAATIPSGPAGAAVAPSATFVAPGSISPTEPSASAVPPVAAAAVPADAQPIEGSEIVARVEDQAILASD